MAEYEEVTGSIEVPKNVGIKGFLKAIEGILRLPRVQSIHIDARGKVDYTHFLREEEWGAAPSVSFDDLLPYAIIRNSRVVELPSPHDNAAIALSQLFSLAAVDHLFPLALVGGANTDLWRWYERSTALPLSDRESLYGLPVFTDRLLEDNTVVLCAGYARGGLLSDTQKSYKLIVPKVDP